MNQAEKINEVLCPYLKLGEIHIWAALEQLAPHFAKSIKINYTRFRAKITMHLVKSGFLEKSNIPGRKDKVAVFTNKKYGVYKAGNRFNNIELAKEFFIEVGFLNPDGTELESGNE